MGIFPDTMVVVTRSALACGVVALLVWAALEDLRARRVPNVVPLGLLVLFPLHVGLAEHVPAWAPSLLGAAGLFVVLLLLWQRGLLGGGDVKLAAALALWLGLDHLPEFLLATSLLGGVLALLTVLRLSGPGAAVMVAFGTVDGTTPPGTTIPYAVAIVGAGLPLLLPSLV